MNNRMNYLWAILFMGFVFFGCSETPEGDQTATTEETPMSEGDQLLQKYVNVRLTTDLDQLSEKEKQMIPLLIEAAKVMDNCFWYEAYGDKDAFLNGLEAGSLKKFARINYGPWDRLNGNEPFIEGVEAKPLGANYYPNDMSKEEFEQSDLADKASLYTFVRRNEEGKLMTKPYRVQFEQEVKKVANLLQQAAALAEDAGLKNYLELRSEALLTDEYQPSDLAWMDMKTNTLDVVIGPIETYEDQLFGYKAAHEAYVLVKDQSWSERLAKYADFLPALQEGLPVDDAYKQEEPGTDADLNAYDVIYYAGDCNSGSKTIAINLPNDEEVQLQKGTRRLQLKNAMKAKFDKILMPISGVLIAEDQRKHITFDAFFSNTMFHEVAHGLGIKKLIDGSGATVRESLKEHASALEEGKADILGLYMINQMHERGEITGDLHDYYVTFMASIFRSVRFGASSAHGKANMIRFNYFKEKGAFERLDDGTYRVNFDQLAVATNDLTELILTLQGDGNYDGAAKLVAEKAVINDQLQSDLDRLKEAGIPVDVVFEQGLSVLGLSN
jgi:hypothetical protein